MMDLDHEEIFESFEDEFQKRKRKKRQGASIPPWMFVLFILIIIFAVLFIKKNPEPQKPISETIQPSLTFSETDMQSERTLLPQAETEFEITNAETFIDTASITPDNTLEQSFAVTAVEVENTLPPQSDVNSSLQTATKDFVPLIITEDSPIISTPIPERTNTAPEKIAVIPLDQPIIPIESTKTDSFATKIPTAISLEQPIVVKITTDKKIESQPTRTLGAVSNLLVNVPSETPHVFVINPANSQNRMEMGRTTTPLEESITPYPTINPVSINTQPLKPTLSAIKIIPTKAVITQVKTVLVQENDPMEQESIKTAISADEIRNDPSVVNAITDVPVLTETETRMQMDSTSTVVPDQKTVNENENWFGKFVNFWKRLFGINPSVSSTATIIAPTEDIPAALTVQEITEDKSALAVQATKEDIPALIVQEITEDKSALAVQATMEITATAVINNQTIEIQESPVTPLILTESVHDVPNPMTESPTEPVEVILAAESITEKAIVTEEPDQEKENLSLIQKLLESIKKLFRKETEVAPTSPAIEVTEEQKSDHGTEDVLTETTPQLSESPAGNESSQIDVLVTDHPLLPLPNAISGPEGTSDEAVQENLLVSNPLSMKDVEITATYSDLDDEPLKFEDEDYSNEPTRTPISENTPEQLPTEISPTMTQISLVRIITLPVTKLTPVQLATATISAHDSGATLVPIVRETMLPETGFAERLNLPMVIFIIMILLVLILSVRVIRSKKSLK